MSGSSAQTAASAATSRACSARGSGSRCRLGSGRLRADRSPGGCDRRAPSSSSKGRKGWVPTENAILRRVLRQTESEPAIGFRTSAIPPDPSRACTCRRGLPCVGALERFHLVEHPVLFLCYFLNRYPALSQSSPAYGVRVFSLASVIARRRVEPAASSTTTVPLHPHMRARALGGVADRTYLFALPGTPAPARMPGTISCCSNSMPGTSPATWSS